jgi:hypothetical protein
LDSVWSNGKKKQRDKSHELQESFVPRAGRTRVLSGDSHGNPPGNKASFAPEHTGGEEAFAQVRQRHVFRQKWDANKRCSLVLLVK